MTTSPLLLVRQKHVTLVPVHFRLAFAERLARDFPDARLHTVSDSLAFVPEDRPDFLAKEILSFVAPTSQGETP